jgi:hypothetical protein
MLTVNGTKHQVPRTFVNNVVGDRHVTAARVPDLRRFHAASLSPSRRSRKLGRAVIPTPNSSGRSPAATSGSLRLSLGDLPRVSLEDAFRPVHVCGEKELPKYERAATPLRQ